MINSTIWRAINSRTPHPHGEIERRTQSSQRVSLLLIFITNHFKTLELNPGDQQLDLFNHRKLSCMQGSRRRPKIDGRRRVLCRSPRHFLTDCFFFFCFTIQGQDRHECLFSFYLWSCSGEPERPCFEIVFFRNPVILVWSYPACWSVKKEISGSMLVEKSDSGETQKKLVIKVMAVAERSFLGR